MNRVGTLSSRFFTPALAGILAFSSFSCSGTPPTPGGPAPARTGGPQPPQTAAPAPLSADDVSWLFPAPTRAEDFGKLIAVRELTAPNPQDPTKRDPVWPAAVFQQFIAIANSAAAQVAGTQARIGLPAEAQSMDAWFIAGIRIDAGAPGLSDDIRAQFGQSPEIRLIIQPVTRNPDGTPQVHDIAGHLIFDFTLPQALPAAQAGCLPTGRPVPDLKALKGLVTELAAIRTQLKDGKLGADKVTTSNVPLGVHPGLADATTADQFRQRIKTFLEAHISGQRLDAMAIAGLPAGSPAPWIFLSMTNVHPGVVPSLPNGGVFPVPGPTLDGHQLAQLLMPKGTSPRVAPQPHTNNLNPITCKNAAVSAASLPVAQRAGVATADVLGIQGVSNDKIVHILDTVADPNRSHFFNTDCISCHTETRAAMELLGVNTIPGVDTAVLPDSPWDVRNFGWSPGGSGSAHATVTRRTAAETAAVVTFINSQVLGK